LMLAAIKDNPDYLEKLSFASQITSTMRASLSKLKAVIADHPDPMYSRFFSPDIPNFKVKSTPVFVITGSKDQLEPNASGWKDFQMVSSQNKVFLNMHGSSHLEPNFFHREGPFIAYFAQFFALGDAAAGQRIYGSGPLALRNILEIARPGDKNSGDGKVAFLACSDGGEAVPPELGRYCMSASQRDTVIV